MNILNQFFKKIYVISSYATSNRLNDIIPFFEKENIDFELVIAPKRDYFQTDWTKSSKTKGTHSHISATESIFLKESFIKSDSFCIMEDDVFFADDYVNKLKLLFSCLPSDWEVLNPGYHEYTILKSQNANVFYKLEKGERICGAHIVAYKNNTVPFIMDKLNICRYPMDWFLCDEVYSNFNTYVCLDQIFYGSSYREQENNKHLFYKKYESEVLL